MTAIRDMMTDTAGYSELIEKSAGKLRHELKYSISEAQDTVIAATLRKLFRHDGHADSHGSYRVSSLYFDTPYDKAVKEKLAGVIKREKFRLRYYGDDMSFIRLEKKYKHGNLCGKRSAALTYDQVMRIIEGDADFMLCSGDPLLVSFTARSEGSS